MTSIITRLTQTINDKLSNLAVNNRLWNESKQQAIDWTRYSVGHCDLHNATMFHDLDKARQGKPEHECYTCWQCEKERHDKEIAQSRQRATQALFIQPGSLSASVRATLQKSLIRNVISAISTAPSLDERELATIPTNKLYNPNPATPKPETRAELFQNVPIDLPDSLILWDEEDSDATEMRPKMKITAPRIATSTQEIPAFHAEVLLADLARGATHEQGTGEQEPVREKHWML